MTDKEVGELWKNYTHISPGWNRPAEREVLGLIRKLVEERKRWILRDWANTRWHSEMGDATKIALDDFGIPEDSWQEKS